MQQAVELASFAQASCRTDFSVHSFKTPTTDSVEDLLGYLLGLGEALFPTRKPLEHRKGKHYTHLYIHPIGLRFSTCQSASSDSENLEHPNYGNSLVEIPGQVWGLLDAKNRNHLIADIASWEGLYRTTRWDPQITILNPEQSAGEIVDAVQAGEMWCKGYGTQQPYADRNQHGELKGGATQYFGSKQANVRVRIYDKAAQSGWNIPALRVEAQLRHEPANQHFKRLGQRCIEQLDNAPLLTNAEDTTVKEALSQHADLRDTTKWAGKRKPKNWAQEAPKIRWWDSALDGAYNPLSVTYKPALELDKTIDHMVKQYGRKVILHVIKDAYERGCGIQESINHLIGRGGAYLKDEDHLELAKMCPTADPAKLSQMLKKCADYGHTMSEWDVGEKRPKPPFV